jgi:ATP-dependent DNA helicase DinG
MQEEVRNVELTVIEGGQKNEPTGDYIKETFGEGGHLSKLIPGYEPRDGQIRMARAIDNGIRKQAHIIAEGPTGTGKSLAYSTPAAYHAAYTGKRVCIVTANKNLQRQIYEKDLALLRDAVPWKFTYAVRKGISSYLCARDRDSEKYREFLLQGNLSHGEENMVHETAEWAENTRTGDFEESPGPPHKIWSQFATTRDDCNGRKCFAYDECFVAAAKAKADNADIIVTNYHLLFIHLKLGETSKILPPFDVVILDEAHRAAKTARDFFGDEITFSSLYRCVTNMHMVDVRGFKKRGERIRTKLLDEARKVWTVLAARARDRKAIFEKKTPLDSERLEEALAEAVTFYGELAAKIDPGPKKGRIQNATEARMATEAENYRKLKGKCEEKREQLFQFRDCTAKGMVFFIEGSGREEKGKWVKLKSKAVEVGGYMHHALFKRFPTVVQTSATLAIRGGGKSNFEYVRREMGMNGIENISEIVVDSPFDWEKQGLLVIPRSMPVYQYGDESWDLEVCKHIEKTVNLVGGRTLGLFSSKRMMEAAAEHLRRKTGHTIYVQYEATNRELVDRFQRDVGSILLGTESFSEGVSIEGEACTCVVLDKIPFTPKNDPVMYGIEKALKARRSRQSSFDAYSLPEAIISFKQRVGRLIRTVNDVGVVVVLDKRLHTKGYRHQFTRSVAFDRVHDDLGDITPFLRRVGAL